MSRVSQKGSVHGHIEPVVVRRVCASGAPEACVCASGAGCARPFGEGATSRGRHIATSRGRHIARFTLEEPAECLRSPGRPSPISAATSRSENLLRVCLAYMIARLSRRCTATHLVAATALIVALLVEDGAVVSAAIGKGPLHLDVVHDAVRALDHQVVDIGRRLSLPWPSVVEKTSTSLAASDMKSSTA